MATHITMNMQNNASGKQLENAFEMFNQFSEKLADSYSILENQVKHLSGELTVARSKRLLELAEKEVLATRLESLLDALPAGIVVLDADNFITQVNPIARLMLERASIDGDGQNKKLIGMRWKIVAQNCITSDDSELRLLEGEKAGSWINITICPLSNTNSGNDQGSIVLISDVTELRSLQCELNRQQRLSSLGEMIASLAHQIRTPLASALLYISTINHPHNDSDERAYFAEKTKERLHHLERMVNDMLVFARGDALDAETIDTYMFMFKLKNLLESNHKMTNIRVSFDENLSDVSIRANGDAVLSGMQNIVDNAIEACNEWSDDKVKCIEVHGCCNEDNQFELTIKDNGCGMSVDVQDKILEPFFTTRSSGTGLGLSVVNAMVHRYQGAMVIDSEEGKGSCFRVTFPAAAATGLLSSNLSMNKELNPIIKKSISNSIVKHKQLIDEKEVLL